MAENTEHTLSAYLGPEFQQRLMWQLLVEPEFAEKTIPNLAIEYFDDPYLKRLFIIILEYFKAHEKVPNLQNQSIQQAINTYKTPNNIIEEESLFAVIKKIELWNERVINKQILYEGDVVRRETTNFIKQQEYRKTGEFIITSTKNGDIRKKTTIALIEEKFNKVQHIGDDEDYGISVFDNIEHALRKEFRQTIPTGIFAIDTLTGGGLGKQEIGVILTPSGVGKTTMLTVIANSAYDDQKNVCQIIFEDTKEQIQRKHFTIWAKSSLSKLDDEFENIRVNRIAHEKAVDMSGKGNLIIKRFSQENTTMMDIRRWMIGYQKKFGIKFDILVLDYLDCLESHKKSPDRNEAELVIIKSFEALAADFDIPAWTAIQTNRSGFNAEYVEAYQTGGSIKRVQKAHFFMSVAKTADQKEANLASIRIIKARFAQDGQTFTDCIFNNDTMEIRIEDKRYPLKTTLRKQTEDDVNKVNDTANEILKKSSDLEMHAIISKHSEGSLMGRLNAPDINDHIKLDDPVDLTQFDKLVKTENATIENIHISTTRDLNSEELKQIVDFAQKTLNETEGVNDGVTEGVNDGVKNTAIETTKKDDILEIDETVKIEGVNEGASEGVNEGVNIHPEADFHEKQIKNDSLLDWSGETFTVNVNETEVKLEDISPPKEIIVETVVQKYDEINKNNRVYLPPEHKLPVEILTKERREEIEKTELLIDPDAPPVDQVDVFKRLRNHELHQPDIIKK
jgi:replicative DNA helicase